MKSLLLAAILAMAAGAVGQQPATKPHEERYASATIDSYGHLVIRTTDGREIIPRMDRATFDSEGRLVLTPMSEPVRDDEQGGFASPAISADKRTVGWLALFPAAAGSVGIRCTWSCISTATSSACKDGRFLSTAGASLRKGSRSLSGRKIRRTPDPCITNCVTRARESRWRSTIRWSAKTVKSSMRKVDRIG